ncbi:hypothetical protein D3C71_19090 [compost metagenome]
MKKQEALAGLRTHPETINRLFFQARNLAIEAMLLRLENKLLRAGYPAECEWKESSFGPPTIELRMRNTGRGEWEYGTCALRLRRERLTGVPEFVSDCFYELDSLQASEYWGGRQPAKLLDFRQAVQDLYDTGELATEVAKVNYPFEYEPHSGF